MNEISIQAFINWEEWVSIYRILFFGQENNQFHFPYDSINHQFDKDQIHQLQVCLSYMTIVLNRSKLRNSISFSYTVNFIDQYIQLNQTPSLAVQDELQSYNQVLYKSISLDILRFTSLLSDLNQSAKSKQSINKMLFAINMKEHEYVSEVRHQIAHKQMPSRVLVEKSLVYIIEYIYENYWQKQFSQLQKLKLINEQIVESFIQIILNSSQVKQKIEEVRNCQTSIKQQLADKQHQTTSEERSQQCEILDKQLDSHFPKLQCTSIQGFRSILNKLVKQVAMQKSGDDLAQNYQEQQQILQLFKKKHYLSYLIADILRYVLWIVFYSKSFQFSKDEKKIMLDNLYKFIKWIFQQEQQKFQQNCQKVLVAPFVSFKIMRIVSLASIYPELKPFEEILCQSKRETLNHHEKLISQINSAQLLEDHETNIQSNIKLIQYPSTQIGYFLQKQIQNL